MAKATKIIRRTIHAFFQNYQRFASTATLLLLPFSTIFLLSQSSISSSSDNIRQTISSRLQALFHAAGFPTTSKFFSLLSLKLSQTIFSFLFCLPFTLTFFLLAKATIIQIMHGRVSIPSLSSLLDLYRLILPTHLFNSCVLLSAHGLVFSLLLLAFSTLEVFQLSSENYVLGLSAASAVLYSIVLAKTTVVCSLATIISATEHCRGYLPILEACVLIQGKGAIAITVALPASLGMAAVEALFQHRVVKPYLRLGRLSVPAFSEAFLIAYVYSLLIVFDNILSWMLYRSLKAEGRWDWENEDDRSLGSIQEQKDDLEALSLQYLHLHAQIQGT